MYGYWVCWYVHIHVYIYIYIYIHMCFKEFWQKILRENLVEILVYKIWIVSCICRVWIPRFLYILQKAKILHEYPPPPSNLWIHMVEARKKLWIVDFIGVIGIFMHHVKCDKNDTCMYFFFTCIVIVFCVQFNH